MSPIGRQSSPSDHASTEASTSAALVLSSPSASTLALLSISQDITALLSLSLEATASALHDWARSSLLTVGLGRGQVVKPTTPAERGRCESGRGLAVVLVNANEREYPAAVPAELHADTVPSYRPIPQPPSRQIRLYSLPPTPSTRYLPFLNNVRSLLIPPTCMVINAEKAQAVLPYSPGRYSPHPDRPGFTTSTIPI